MDIWFGTSKASKLFKSRTKLVKKHGDRMADLIEERLASLRACQNFQEAFVVPGRLHPLSGSGDGWFAMDLVHPFRLVIAPGNDPVPVKEGAENEIDFEKVDEAEVIGVIDYH